MKRFFQQGFSLIELMIAVLLGCILLLGVTQLMISASTLGNTSNNLFDNQDTGTSILDAIGGEAQRAGYLGCDKGGMLEFTDSKYKALVKNKYPITPLIKDGKVGIQFRYGVDKNLATPKLGSVEGDPGAELASKDCLDRDLYYREVTYKNCTDDNGVTGLCFYSVSIPNDWATKDYGKAGASGNSQELLANGMIPNASLEKIVLTIPADDTGTKFKNITIGTEAGADYTSGELSTAQLDDIAKAKLATFYLKILSVEPKGDSDKSMTKVERSYSGSYEFRNLSND